MPHNFIAPWLNNDVPKLMHVRDIKFCHRNQWNLEYENCKSKAGKLMKFVCVKLQKSCALDFVVALELHEI